MAFNYLEGVLFLIFLMILQDHTVSSISCYQCNSTDHIDPFQCGEYMTDDIDIDPKPCDSVYGAAYCIKHTGRFEVSGIHCYQCDSTTNIDCGNNPIHDKKDLSLEPTSCGYLFEARYCIKATGLHSGGLGTKRFCSSLDLGNYCNYIRQPGDVMEYRSCVYTCDSDGCNTSTRSYHINLIPFLTFSTLLYLLI